jgi:hypothetical protein
MSSRRTTSIRRRQPPHDRSRRPSKKIRCRSSRRRSLIRGNRRQDHRVARGKRGGEDHHTRDDLRRGEARCGHRSNRRCQVGDRQRNAAAGGRPPRAQRHLFAPDGTREHPIPSCCAVARGSRRPRQRPRSSSFPFCGASGASWRSRHRRCCSCRFSGSISSGCIPIAKRPACGRSSRDRRSCWSRGWAPRLRRPERTGTAGGCGASWRTCCDCAANLKIAEVSRCPAMVGVSSLRRRLDPANARTGATCRRQVSSPSTASIATGRRQVRRPAESPPQAWARSPRAGR